MSNKKMQTIWRYGIVSAIISVIAILIIANVFSTTVINADKWNAKAESVLSRVFLVQPKRGEILACDGSVLATNLTKYTIAIDYRAMAPQQAKFVAALDSLCDSLAYYFPQRSKEQWREHLATPLKNKPKERTAWHVILKDVTHADYMRVKGFPFFGKKWRNKYASGLTFSTREMRVMPYGQMARRSIGRCNFVSVAKFDGATKASDFEDVLHGYSGLESALDKLLYGTTGTARYVQLTHGVRKWVDQPAVNGLSVKTTIDINMQDIVETELHAMLQQTEADWGTCLLMEVATGDIKAISNLDRDKNGNYIEAMNYSLLGFEPGSVMKPISMIVALEDGYAFPLDRHFEIGSTYPFAGGKPIHDTHSPASLPVSRFLEYSSNIGMTKLITPHYKDSLNGFRERLARIGLFDRFNTGMAGERPPVFPELDPKAGGLVSLSRMTYGYATQIPPLYICAVYNAIANDGKFVRPRLYKELIDFDGNVQKLDVSYVRDSICSRVNARILREMIHEVVYGQGGTAKSLRNDVVKVVGKTGTSHIAYEAKRDSVTKKLIGPTGYKEGQYRVAFCGFYPYENPKYTCMVLVSNPKHGHGAATISGMVVKNVALKMFARGMLDNVSYYASEGGASLPPVLYAKEQESKRSEKDVLGIKEVHRMQQPAQHKAGCVPDVTSLGMRDAIARLEDAGYTVRVKGTGYAVRQSPQKDQSAKPGTTVTVEFAHR